MFNKQELQQFKLEIKWLEQKIWELETKLHRKASVQKQIDNLKSQIKHHEYQIHLSL